jgi:hypothetical protein
MQPEVLILQIDKVLRVTERAGIELRNAPDATFRSKTVGVLWDGTRYLYQAVAL